MNKDRSSSAQRHAYIESSVHDSSGIELCTYSFQGPNVKSLTRSVFPPYLKMASRCSQCQISKIGHKRLDDVVSS